MMTMKMAKLGVLAALLVPLGCEGPERDGAVAERQQAVTAETFKVGVLVDNASPARANYTAAAVLAGSQINQALAEAGIAHRFDVIVAGYDGFNSQPVAIDLINNQGVLAMVTDGNQTTADVNRLNYDFNPQVAHKFPVTCYQCGSARFNDVGETDPGYSDFEDWLVRTYFNDTYEPALLVRQILNRPHGGDFNNDGVLKVVVYFDVDHLIEALNVQPALDSLHTGSHTVEPVFKVLPSSPESRAEEMAAIFDSAPDGHTPDAVILMFREPNFLEALGDESAFPVSPRPPALTIDEVRRNYLLPGILAAGGAALQGVSVPNVAPTPSGKLFSDAFVAAAHQPPEMTTAFLYDAVVAEAIAIGWAKSFDTVIPEVIRGNFINISDPTGKLIRPKVSDFKTAALRIKQQVPIDYDGAASPVLLQTDELNPDPVHWKIQGGKFVELERYSCTPDNPTCTQLP